MKIAILGATGFIGGHLLEKLIADGHECLGLDDLSINEYTIPEWAQKIHTKAKLVLGLKGDCDNYDDLKYELNNFKPDTIFNLAVLPLPHSLKFPAANFGVNTSIASNVLRYIRTHDKNIRLIHFSSSEVYGSAQTESMDENHAIKPNTPYAAAKAAADMLVESYVKTYGLDAVIVRPFNTIGPRQNDKSYAAIIPRTVKRIREGKKPIICGTGNNTRDYTAVSDVVEGAIAAMKHGRKGETYNLCTGIETTTLKIMKMISSEMDYIGEFEFRPERPGDVLRHRGNNKKAQECLGWTPKVNIQEAVRRAIWE